MALRVISNFSSYLIDPQGEIYSKISGRVLKPALADQKFAKIMATAGQVV